MSLIFPGVSFTKSPIRDLLVVTVDVRCLVLAEPRVYITNLIQSRIDSVTSTQTPPSSIPTPTSPLRNLTQPLLRPKHPQRISKLLPEPIIIKLGHEFHIAPL